MLCLYDKKIHESENSFLTCWISIMCLDKVKLITIWKSLSIWLLRRSYMKCPIFTGFYNTSLSRKKYSKVTSKGGFKLYTNSYLYNSVR